MIDKLTPILTFFTALGSGLVAGLFFAFSAFVMNALARLPAEKGIAAMQSINIAVLNRLFLTVFMGTTVLCIVLAVISIFNWKDSHSIYLLVGSLLYLLGTFLVTSLCNVPLNDTLAGVTDTDAESIRLWKDFISTWTKWNHVRTITSLMALASFIFVLWRR